MSSYTIPSVIEKTLHGERAVDIYSRLLTDRIIYIGTEIDDGVANVVIAQLLHLESESPDVPINLYLNSPGGSVTASLAIYDTMLFVGSPISTTCVGQVASSAALLLAGGTPGSRMVLPHARVVLHQPTTGGQGALPDLALQAKEIVRLRGEMESILARHTGQAVERLREDTDRDLVLDAQAGGRLRAGRRDPGEPEGGVTAGVATQPAGRPVSTGSTTAAQGFAKLNQRGWSSALGRSGGEGERPGRSSRQGAGDPGGEVDEPQPQRTGNGTEDLGAGLLAAALHLREVLRGDPRILRHVGEGALLPVAFLAELLTDGLTPERFGCGVGGSLPGRERDHISHGPRLGRTRRVAAAVRRGRNRSP